MRLGWVVIERMHLRHWGPLPNGPAEGSPTPIFFILAHKPFTHILVLTILCFKRLSYFLILCKGSSNIIFELVYFNWRIITLQYCGGFCYTFTWISHKCTCVPPFWTLHTTSLRTPSLWVVPEHQLWVPCFMHRTCTGHHFTYGNSYFLAGLYLLDILLGWSFHGN